MERSPSRGRRLVRCPQCGKSVEWTPENPFRPFCSERCKLLDLGQWANEGYRVPSEAAPLDGGEPPAQ